MGSDAISNARLSAFARDSSKKKKGSRLGKLKQNKIDVRRDQWISQVKSKGCKMESDNALPSTIPKPIDRFKAPSNLLMRARRGDEIEHEPLTMSWASKKMGHNHFSSGNDFTQRTTRRCSRRRNICSSFSSNEGEKDYDEGSLCNWEAMENVLPSSNKQTSNLSEDTLKGGRGYLGNARAWAPDDRFRPQSLPRISTKQQQKKKLVMKSSNRWQQMIGSEEASACPICCEDFDITDSSFLPCPCGFRLCLFCHKRILEVDARCPGCRKEYDSAHSGAGFQSETVMAHSWSMNPSKRF